MSLFAIFDKLGLSTICCSFCVWRVDALMHEVIVTNASLAVLRLSRKLWCYLNLWVGSSSYKCW